MFMFMSMLICMFVFMFMFLMFRGGMSDISPWLEAITKTITGSAAVISQAGL